MSQAGLARAPVLHERISCLSDSTQHATIKPYWNSAPFGGAGQTLIFADEQVDAFVGCLPAVRESMSRGNRVIIKCESANFRLHTLKGHVSARVYLGAQYVSFTQNGME